MAEDDRDNKLRPDPDALLALAKKDRRGKLTVFLGAAPGVGKTYAMLSRARRLKADGVDIVVGVVETHGRDETAGLLSGLEVLPRARVAHRGRMIEEFDLDAALAGQQFRVDNVDLLIEAIFQQPGGEGGGDELGAAAGGVAAVTELGAADRALTHLGVQ